MNQSGLSAHDCLEKLIPKEVSEGMQAPVFLQASGTTPHQVVLTCKAFRVKMQNLLD